MAQAISSQAVSGADKASCAAMEASTTLSRVIPVLFTMTLLMAWKEAPRRVQGNGHTHCCQSNNAKYAKNNSQKSINSDIQWT
jgi:hypothetical protein